MAKVTMRMLKKEIRTYSTGFIIGGIVGIAAATYAINQGADLVAIADAGKGLLDTALGRSAEVTEVAKYKMYIVFGSLGAFLGYLTDKYIA